MPSEPPPVPATVILVSYNTRDLLLSCLARLRHEGGGQDCRIIVVDNASADGSVAAIARAFPDVRIIANDENRGFGPACNQAFAIAEGETVVLLNPDAAVLPGSIPALLAVMDRDSKTGVVGGEVRNQDGALEPSARTFPTPLLKFLTFSGLSSRFPRSRFFGRGDLTYADFSGEIEADWVPGTLCALRRTMLESLGGFDERFFLYYEETDLCRRAKQAGWKVLFTPAAGVIHEGGASGKTHEASLTFDPGGAQVLKFRMRSECLYFRKHHGLTGVLAAMFPEILWHVLRFLLHLRPGAVHAAKRRHSQAVVTQALRALADTGCGMSNPATPWS